MTFKEYQKQNCNYDCITTFWEDFTIAEQFGVYGVNKTYKQAITEWKHDYKYITELAIVLNHKCWMHYFLKNEALSDLYSNLFYETRDFACENFTGEAFKYFYKTID